MSSALRFNELVLNYLFELQKRVDTDIARYFMKTCPHSDGFAHPHSRVLEIIFDEATPQLKSDTINDLVFYCFLNVCSDFQSRPLSAYPKCRFFCWCEASCRWQWKARSQTLQVSDSSAKEIRSMEKKWKNVQVKDSSGRKKENETKNEI